MRMDANTQRKRLRRNGAAQASDDSKSSDDDDEVQQICDVQNSSEAETEDESEVAEKSPSARPAHVVSKKTKCWLFFEVPAKGMKIN